MKPRIEIKITEEKDQTEQERRDYCAAIFASFPRLETDIKQALHARLVYTAMETKNWEDLMMNRGIMEGMTILLEQWRAAQGEHISNNSAKPEFNQFNPVSEI